MHLTFKKFQLPVLIASLFMAQWSLSAQEGTLLKTDIGSGELGSSASYDDGSKAYQLSASGGNIWGNEDNFHFVNSAITGDVEITVKLSSLQAATEDGKAGIMFRQSLDEDSIHAFLKVSAGQMVALERRHQTGDGTTRSGKGNVSAPVWLRLVKMGTYISAYYSEDGDKWEFLAEDTINFTNTVYVGLAVSSDAQGQSVDATFEDLSVLDLDNAHVSETYVSSDIGKVGVNGNAAFDSNSDSYIVEASGGDIGHTQDAFHFVYREIYGDFEGVVKLDTMIAQEDWAKAGLMIRGDEQPDSKYVSLFLTKNVGVVYQSRSAVGGGSDWSKTDGIVDPIWIKLVRAGNSYSASYSLNGSDWVLQDSVTMDMPDRVLFGMALTSHAEGSLAYAEFSNLSDSTIVANNINNSLLGGIGEGSGHNNNNINDGGGDSGSSDPEAAFTSGVANRGSSLTVNVDASSSVENGSEITEYSWDWGDGSAVSNGAQASHTYESAGVYLVALTVKDASGTTNRVTHPVQVTTGSIPSTEIEIVEKGYRHVRLRWSDNQQWDSPFLIQRSTVPAFVDPTNLVNNQQEDNTASGTFRWLGINATQYVDIDGMEEGFTYYYRVAACTNLSDHYQKGATPQFSSWQYGEVTLGTLEAAKKRTFNVVDFGAVANDGNNDYPAAHAAFKAAESAGGGIIFFPAGNWDLWPTDSDVKLVNGQLTVENGKKATNKLFFVGSDNITFLGEKSGGNPTSFLKFYLWHKQPATNYLEVLSGGPGSSVKDIKRYFIFLMNNAKDFTIKDLDIDMGATPVNTGKAWYSLDEKRYQWDISHKLLASFDTLKFKNVVVDNIRAKNCRGEVIYNGGGSEKLLIKDSVFSRTNSSTLSGTFDLELVNTTIRDSANSSVESNCLNDAVSFDTGEIYPMNHIARGCTFIGLDQSDQGFMKDLPGKKNFGGWLCFNEEGTYQSVTDSSFSDTLAVAFGPWYEYRNGFRFNVTFNEIPQNMSGQLVYTWTSGQHLYTLEGGMSNILWLGDTVNVTKDWPNHQLFFYSQPGPQAANSESPWTWEALHFKNVNGGNHKVNRIWVDTGGADSREDAIFKDWTYDPGITFDAGMFQFLSAGHVDPEYVNFLE